MEQRIYPDPYGRDTWDGETATTVHVHIATTEMWRQITAEAPPPSPISARTYTDFGLPWFRLHDEHRGDLEPSEILAGVKSVDALTTVDLLEGGSLSLPDDQLVTLRS